MQNIQKLDKTTSILFFLRYFFKPLLAKEFIPDLKMSFKNNKISLSGRKAKFLNLVTTTKATWNGHNASGFKEDIIKVNGFDERMKYGCQDRELGERLVNIGIKPKQIRYSAIVIHLNHSREYNKEESWIFNNRIRKNTVKNKIKFTEHGIIKHIKN